MSWSGASFPGSPQQPGGQVTEGSITYTTSTGPDGRIVYHPFRAVPASYQTPNGPVTGIQWVPAEATQVLPHGAQPANAEFVASWNRGDVSHRESKLIKEWQHDEEKRRKKEEKEAAKRLRYQDEELRKARDLDGRGKHGLERKRSFNAPPNPGPGPGAYGGYPAYDRDRKHSTGPSDLARGFGDLDLERDRERDREYDRERDRGGYERERKVSFNAGDGGLGRPRQYSVGAPERPRRLSNVGGDRPAIYQQSATSQGAYGAGAGGYPSSPFAGAASPNMRPAGSHYVAGTSGYPGPYPSSPNRVPLGEPIARAPSPYNNPPVSVYPKGHVLEGQPIGPRSRAPSPMPGPQAEFPMPSVRGPPSPYVGGALGGPPLPLETPAAFSRPVNAAQSYTLFETMKIQDMDDFVEHVPRMPLVLQPHDVFHDDWIRLMQDLSRAWAGNLPVRDVSGTGRPPKRSTLARDLIDLWNLNFFLRRGVEIVLYKGRERRSGSKIGVVDIRPGYDDGDSSSSSSSSEDSDISGEERVMAQEYGVYGRQPVGQMTEMLEARRRRREKKAEKKRKSREKKLRRSREKERQYALYLTCINPSDIPHGPGIVTGLGGGVGGKGGSVGSSGGGDRGYGPPGNYGPSGGNYGPSGGNYGGYRPPSAMGHSASGGPGYPSSGGYGSNYRD